MEVKRVAKVLAPLRMEQFSQRQSKRRKSRPGFGIKSNHRNHVMPMGGPENLAVGGRVFRRAEFAVFDDKAANAVLADAETHLRSGYPTIATSSMVARRSHVTSSGEFEFFKPDVRFFSELVKPIQYRWHLRNSNGRTLSPSKHGYHPRSKSPTFRRLIEATEKLQILSEYDSGMGSIDKSEEEFETQSNLSVDKELPIPLHIRQIKSEPPSVRSDTTVTEVTSKQQAPVTRAEPEVKGTDLRTIGSLEETEEMDSEEGGCVTPQQRQEFKVDFKKLDSHSELHLFLPHIQESKFHGDIPDSPNFQQNTKFSFPPISEFPSAKEGDKNQNAKKGRGKGASETKRKKKRPVQRVKSGTTEKPVWDTLNDIPTLISMENEKDLPHTGSMCVFDNCAYHPHQKSSRIRQP